MDSTIPDFDWVVRYYSNIFPQGWENLQSQLSGTENILLANPFIGRVADDFDGLRELNIAKTPFTLIYRVTNTHIEVLRVWDQRQDRAKLNP